MTHGWSWTTSKSLCDLLERAAVLLAITDGCCHQLHQTPRWRDSELIGGWLTDLAENLQQRTHAAFYDAQYDDYGISLDTPIRTPK